jgi:homospermidine synthase
MSSRSPLSRVVESCNDIPETWVPQMRKFGHLEPDNCLYLTKQYAAKVAACYWFPILSHQMGLVVVPHIQNPASLSGERGQIAFLSHQGGLSA